MKKTAFTTIAAIILIHFAAFSSTYIVDFDEGDIDYDELTYDKLIFEYGFCPDTVDEDYTIEIFDGAAKYISPQYAPTQKPRYTGVFKLPEEFLPIESDFSYEWTFPYVTEFLLMGETDMSGIAVAGCYIRGQIVDYFRHWSGGEDGDFWCGYIRMRNGGRFSGIAQGTQLLAYESFEAGATVSYRLEKSGSKLRLWAKYDDKAWHVVGDEVDIELAPGGSPAIGDVFLRCFDPSGKEIEITADNFIFKADEIDGNYNGEIDIVEPDGALTYDSFSDQKIYWKSENIEYAKIEITYDNGFTWQELVSSLPANAGEFAWTIPDASTNECRVKISDFFEPLARDESLENFTIKPSSNPAKISGVGFVGDSVKLPGEFQYATSPATDCEGAVYFADTSAGAIYKIPASGGEPELFFDGLKSPCGLSIDRKGAILFCQAGAGIISQIDPVSLELETIASTYGGKRFNSPRDLIVDSRGGAYFIDIFAGETRYQTSEALYYIDNRGELRRVAKLEKPVSVALSPDENQLYIAADTSCIYVCDIESPGVIGEMRLFSKISSTKNSRSAAIAIDSSGRLYAAVPDEKCFQVFDRQGAYLGRAPFDAEPNDLCFGGDMTRVYVSAGKSVFAADMLATGLRPGRLSGIDSTNILPIVLGDIYSDYGKDVSVDINGNIYAVGYFQGTIDLDYDAVGQRKFVSKGSPDNPGAVDIYFAKYDENGVFRSGFPIGSEGGDAPHSVETDVDGNVYIAGNFGGDADFDPSGAVANYSAGAGENAFIVKYDESNAFQWALSIGDEETPPLTPNDSRYENASDLAVDSDGNVYITGYFNGSVDFEPSDAPDTRDSFSSAENGSGEPTRDVFLASYSSDGDFRWAYAAGEAGRDQGHAVKVDSDGNCYISGYFQGTVDFNPASIGGDLTSNGLIDCFIAKFDESGRFKWAKSFGSSNDDQIRPGAMALDQSGNIIVAGDFGGDILFEPGGETFECSGSSYGAGDFFLAKFNPDGELIWAKTAGGEGGDAIHRIDLDYAGNIFATGWFRSTVDIAPSLSSVEPVNAESSGAGSDVFIAKYGADGTPKKIISLGGASRDAQIGAGIAVDYCGNVVATGKFSLSADFDPSENKAKKSAAGDSDAFIAKFDNNLDYIIPNGGRKIELVSPNGGEILYYQQPQSARWESSGVNFVKVEFSSNEGENWSVEVESTPASGEAALWRAPELDKETRCKIRVSDAENPNVFDESDSTFTVQSITLPELTVIAPNGGERFFVGEDVEIRWKAVNNDDLSLYVSTSEGENWQKIGEARKDDSIFVWTPQGIDSKRCMIRVTDIFNITDESDAPFSIIERSFKNLGFISGELVDYNENLNENEIVIRFKLTVDKLWRLQAPPANWNAVRIFIKHRLKSFSGVWSQWRRVGELSDKATDYTSSGESGVELEFAPDDDGNGFFVYLAKPGESFLNGETITLKWKTILPESVVDVDFNIIGIETIYIPEGEFFVGDGDVSTEGAFREGGVGGGAFRVASEPIELKDESGGLWADESEIVLREFSPAAYAWGESRLSETPPYELIKGEEPSGVLSEYFPTGYDAFYIMKYETTQGLYAEFLNSLPTKAAQNRFPAGDGYNFDIVFENGKYVANAPLTACNRLSWSDAAALLDWATLRPTSELEFEKACRGTQAPVAGEYAWGSLQIAALEGVDGEPGSGEETPLPDYANASFDADPDDKYGETGFPGAYRVGLFELAETKARRGESFYGVLDMSGDVSEPVVTVANKAGRAFRGTCGDGALDADGRADSPDWPQIPEKAHPLWGAYGFGCRGGDFATSENTLRTSNRSYAALGATGRRFAAGVRGVRNAPRSVDGINNSQLPRESFIEIVGAYPQPFTSSAIIAYWLASDAFVDIEIADVFGGSVSRIEKSYKRAGLKTFEINLSEYPSGTYFCRISAKGVVRTAKLIKIE